MSFIVWKYKLNKLDTYINNLSLMQLNFVLCSAYFDYNAQRYIIAYLVKFQSNILFRLCCEYSPFPCRNGTIRRGKNPSHVRNGWKWGNMSNIATSGSNCVLFRFQWSIYVSKIVFSTLVSEIRFENKLLKYLIHYFQRN